MLNNISNSRKENELHGSGSSTFAINVCKKTAYQAQTKIDLYMYDESRVRRSKNRRGADRAGRHRGN